MCTRCVNCLKEHESGQSSSFNSILKKPHDESTSSSSSFYTNNSINSTNSMLTSPHSQAFNRLIEEFLSRATNSSARSEHTQESNASVHVNQAKKGSSSSCKSFVYFKNNSEKKPPKSSRNQAKSTLELNKIFNISSTMTKSSNDSRLSDSCESVDDRLSFRVTNLTMQDLKNRQKLIEIKKSASMNVFLHSNS